MKKNPAKANIIPKLTCIQCGHTWMPRKVKVDSCPQCGSYYWDTPKVRKWEEK